MPATAEDETCNGETYTRCWLLHPPAWQDQTVICWLAVWVFCGDAASCGDFYQQCWLKHLVSLYAVGCLNFTFRQQDSR